jgi:hypothetical protein
MTSEDLKNPNNIEQTTTEAQSKQALNQKTSWQFIISTTLGILTIIIIAAVSYRGLIRF